MDLDLGEIAEEVIDSLTAPWVPPSDDDEDRPYRVELRLPDLASALEQSRLGFLKLFGRMQAETCGLEFTIGQDRVSITFPDGWRAHDVFLAAYALKRAAQSQELTFELSGYSVPPAVTM